MTTETMIKELRQLETKVRTGKKKNGELRMQDMVVAVADRLEELNEPWFIVETERSLVTKGEVRMNARKATAIFKQTNENMYTDMTKLAAIYQVLNLPTHNGISKDSIIAAFKWMFDFGYELEIKDRKIKGEKHGIKEIKGNADL